ncbi:hypothetical protein BGZ46_004836 [Entomortierella lignicola]|nr:hypothetical protein BGZ46_004836 [Entomortierella lignicola]
MNSTNNKTAASGSNFIDRTCIRNDLMVAVLSKYLGPSQLIIYTCTPHLSYSQNASATTLRRVIGAAIVQMGADARVRTVGALGMIIDSSITSIKDIGSIYKRY